MVQCTVCDRFKKFSEWVKLTEDEWKELQTRKVTIHHRVCPTCHEKNKNIFARLQGVCEDRTDFETCGVEG